MKSHEIDKGASDGVMTYDTSCKIQNPFAPPVGFAFNGQA